MPNKLQAAQHLTYILNVVAPLPGKDPITLRSHSPYGPFHKNDVFYLKLDTKKYTIKIESVELVLDIETQTTVIRCDEKCSIWP